MTNVGKILDRSIKITMLCVRVLRGNNRVLERLRGGKIGGILAFLKVKIIGKKGVIFVEIFTGFGTLKKG